MKKNYLIVCLAQAFRTFVSAIMNQKTSYFRFSSIRDLLGKSAMTAFLLAVFIVPAFSQDDDETIAGKVMDNNNRQVGKAELILNTGDVKTNFGYDIRIWLDDGSRLRIVRPHSGSRSSTINCSFREYKVDSNNPKDDSRWNETGSGTDSLKMPASGDVQKITALMTLTKKVVGEDEVAVSDKPQKFVIVID